LSIKDELEYVKEELSSDEKLLENAFKLERFYKKHKIKIWAVLILVVGGFGGKAIFDAYSEHKLNVANQALLTLEANPKDSKALEELKSNNPKLYSLYLYSTAIKNQDIKTLQELTNGDDKLILDLAKYHINILKNRAGESKYYKDLATLEKAYEYIKEGKKAKAKELLSMIDVQSPVANIANLLKHFTIE
jgi:hypothetical protein